MFFYQYLFGFRNNNNHAIITLVEKVSKALDTRKYVVSIFLDLKKHLTPMIQRTFIRQQKYGDEHNTF